MLGLPIRSVVEPRKLVVADPQTSVGEVGKQHAFARVDAAHQRGAPLQAVQGTTRSGW